MKCNPLYMEKAISLAKGGIGAVNPNPLVGAVIVKDDRIIGQGYHQHYGGLHAERHALLSCTENPLGATMYVTLEPCCHHGRTPPCTEAILRAGIAHVVVGSSDPNPLVQGKGIQALRDADIQVTEHFLEEECDNLNPVFFHYIKQNKPYIALKYAMTADGKIASYTGDSRWISNEVSRQHTHTLRHAYTGILVGIGTVLADNPLLNCRTENGRNPIRILCDSRLRIPLDNQLCQSATRYRTIIAYVDGSKEKCSQLEALGILLWQIPEKNNHVDLSILMERLAENQIDSILAEGGGDIHFSLLEEGLVQKVYVYIAPKICGGTNAPTPVKGAGIANMHDALPLVRKDIQFLGDDLLIVYETDRKGGTLCSQD